MKNLLLLLFCLALLNCKNEKATKLSFQSNIESYLKAHGQAGEDYHFICITDIDTVSEKEFLDRQMETLSLQLTNKDLRLKKMDSLEVIFKKTISENPKDEITKRNLNDLTRGKTELYVMQHKLDSLKATFKPELSQNIKFIGLNFSFNNKQAGATVRHNYYVKLDEQMQILSVGDLQQ